MASTVLWAVPADQERAPPSHAPGASRRLVSPIELDQPVGPAIASTSGDDGSPPSPGSGILNGVDAATAR
jgi:hypothetical protein